MYGRTVNIFIVLNYCRRTETVWKIFDIVCTYFEIYGLKVDHTILPKLKTWLKIRTNFRISNTNLIQTEKMSANNILLLFNL